jgi:L-aspartate oxidase
MLIVARLMIAAAEKRDESRGVHTRRDFAGTDPGWARHIAFRPPSTLEAPGGDGARHLAPPPPVGLDSPAGWD